MQSASGVSSSSAPIATEALKDAVREYSTTPFAKKYPFHDHEFAPHLFQLELALKYLPSTNPGVVLDIGTGRSVVLRAFQKLGFQCITLDYPVTGGSEALHTAAAAGIDARECDCSAQIFPVESGSVDCVFLADVIEHLPHSPRFLLEEIHRVLRPDGICVTSTPNAVRLTVRLKMLVGASNWPRVSDYYEATYHGGHHHEYTEKELRYVHDRAGFRVVDLQYLELNALHAYVDGFDSLQAGLRPPSDGSSRFSLARKMIFGVTQAFPKLRGQMYLVARK